MNLQIPVNKGLREKQLETNSYVVGAASCSPIICSPLLSYVLLWLMARFGFSCLSFLEGRCGRWDVGGISSWKYMSKGPPKVLSFCSWQPSFLLSGMWTWPFELCGHLGAMSQETHQKFCFDAIELLNQSHQLLVSPPPVALWTSHVRNIDP